MAKEKIQWDPLLTRHDYNTDASACLRSLDRAYFSFENSSDFDYFLNGLLNKINAYKKMQFNYLEQNK